MAQITPLKGGNSAQNDPSNFKHLKEDLARTSSKAQFQKKFWQVSFIYIYTYPMTSEILCVTNLKEQIIPAPILFSMTGTQYLMTHFLERNMKRSNVVPFLDSTSSI